MAPDFEVVFEAAGEELSDGSVALPVLLLGRPANDFRNAQIQVKGNDNLFNRERKMTRQGKC